MISSKIMRVALTQKTNVGIQASVRSVVTARALMIQVYPGPFVNGKGEKFDAACVGEEERLRPTLSAGRFSPVRSPLRSRIQNPSRLDVAARGREHHARREENGEMPWKFA